MSVVYLARDRRHDRRVAVKVLRPEIAVALGPDRFLREIRIASQLTHPNILPLYDSGEDGGLLYYVSPFVEGETLRHRLAREGQLPIDDAVRIAREIADALQHAHDHGVIHRDIKPENILLEADHAVVADFGIARAIDVSAGERLTSSGIAFGTRAYMSPEQALGGSRIDGHTDIYSLGCLLYEMLAGVPPFVAGTAQALTAMHLTEPPPSIAALRPSVPPHVADAVAKALAKLPADRQRDVSELARSLLPPRHEDVARDAPPRERRAAPLMLSALALVVMLVATIWLGSRIATTPPIAAREIGLVLLPIEVGGESNGALDRVAPELHRDLGELIALFPGLRWIDGANEASSGRSTRDDELSAMLAAARRRGASYVVRGTITADRWRSEVISAADGRRVAQTTIPVRAEHAEDAAGRLAMDVIRAVATREGLGGGARAMLLGSTSTAAALGHLMEGERKFWNADAAGAVDEYREAARIDPACALAFHRWSVVEEWQLHYPEALAAVDTALAHRDRFESPWIDLLLGQRYYVLRRGDSAATYFQRSVADHPELADGWLGLGESLFDLGWFSGHEAVEARQPLERALALDSTLSRVHHHLIDLAIQAGDTASALRFIARAHPQDDFVRQRRTLILLRTGTASERARAFAELATAERFTLSNMIAVSARTSGGLALADSLAHFLLAPGRTASDRLRGAEYRLLTGESAVPAPERIGEWKREYSGQDIDGWMASVVFAGLLPRSELASMLRRAGEVVERADRSELFQSRQSDATQALLLLTHDAIASADSGAVERLRRTVERGASSASPGDPLPSSLLAALDARLALLAADTARAVAALGASVARIDDRYSFFFPLVAMAPERLMLARLLASSPTTSRESSRWFRSFSLSHAPGDLPFARSIPRSSLVAAASPR